MILHSKTIVRENDLEKIFQRECSGRNVPHLEEISSPPSRHSENRENAKNINEKLKNEKLKPTMYVENDIM